MCLSLDEIKITRLCLKKNDEKLEEKKTEETSSLSVESLYNKFVLFPRPVFLFCLSFSPSHSAPAAAC